MCHERWLRRDRWREEHFDEELQYLLDETDRPEPATPVVENEPDEEPTEPLRVEAGAAG